MAVTLARQLLRTVRRHQGCRVNRYPWSYGFQVQVLRLSTSARGFGNLSARLNKYKRPL